MKKRRIHQQKELSGIAKLRSEGSFLFVMFLNCSQYLFFIIHTVFLVLFFNLAMEAYHSVIFKDLGD